DATPCDGGSRAAIDPRRPAVHPAVPPHADLGDGEEGARGAVARRQHRAALGAGAVTTSGYTMTIHRFSFPTTIHFGAGARTLVAGHLRDAGCRRPLIVTDKALAALPVLTEFRSHLGGLDVAVFDGVFGNPTARQVMAGAAAFKAHRADSVIGFGGGAALDVAKVVGVMAVHEGDVLEYAWDHPHVRPIVNPLPHFVALPTTAGTGS